VTAPNEVPPGFGPVFRTSPFLESVGTFYSKGMGAEMVLGVFVDERAVNARGTAHGGFLCGLADVALGYALATSQTPAVRLSTVSLSVDFAGAAKLGDWIETRVDIQRMGAQVAYANAYLYVDDKRIVRASGVFVRAPSSPNDNADS
jgi:acyl-coenzyme A thioesterase 13